MKLAEALQQRKALNSDAYNQYHQSASDYMTHEEGEEPNVPEAEHFLDSIESKYAEMADLSAAINRTNNSSYVEVDGQRMTLMDAICERDCLQNTIEAYRSIIQTISGNKYRMRDEVRQFPVIAPRAIRQRKDAYEARMRRLDVVIQQANWTVDLLE